MKTNRNKLLILLLLLLVQFRLPAQQTVQQKVWSLEECIIYAIDHNIQIKQQVIQTEYQKNSLDLAKLKLLPTLNGQGQYAFAFNRSLDPTTNVFRDQSGQNANFYVGGSLPLFQGLVNYNSIKKNQAQLLATEQDLQAIKDNVALNVALAYLQILLNKELVTATGDQLKITLQQIEKSKKLVEAGSAARGTLLQIEAQAASEEVQLINIQNQLETSYLSLTQLLELKTPEGFQVSVPEIPVDSNTVIAGNIEDIYQQAIGTRPEVKSSELQLSASQYDLKAAQGGRYPSLSMSHSLSTYYSNLRQKVLGVDPVSGIIYGPYPFNEQVSDFKNIVIGFNLSIPILNGWQANKRVANSKLAVENSNYTLEATKKQLYKNIQQAYTDATASLKKYASSMKAVISTEESFRYTEQKFNVGLVTPVDYNTAKNQLLKAQADLAQSKYEFIFKTKVLDFYKGIPITLPQ
jgi:outer membrane protein